MEEPVVGSGEALLVVIAIGVVGTLIVMAPLLVSERRHRAAQRLRFEELSRWATGHGWRVWHGDGTRRDPPAECAAAVEHWPGTEYAVYGDRAGYEVSVAWVRYGPTEIVSVLDDLIAIADLLRDDGGNDGGTVPDRDARRDG